MKSESTLSSGSNMALGGIPLIVTMLSNSIASVDHAVFIGSGTGLLLLIMYFALCKPKITHFILYSNAAVLSFFCIIILTKGDCKEWLHNYLPLLLEITIILPLLIVYLNRKKCALSQRKDKKSSMTKEQISAMVLTISSIRTLFILASIHFTFIILGLLITGSTNSGFMWFLLHIAPILVFVSNILIGYVELNMLRTIKDQEFVPIVTASGEVIGKVNKDQALTERKNAYTYPVIRIAVVSHNMLFLYKRSFQSALDKEKFDIPLESYLLFQEDINSGVERLLKEAFPFDWRKFKPYFSIKYSFRNEDANRLVYLFILDLGVDDAVLCDPKFDCGKLWTLQQIEYNLNHNYFGEMFENEYEHLKIIIETRGKYKGS